MLSIRKWASMLLLGVALAGGFVEYASLKQQAIPTNCDPTGCGGG